MATNIFQDSSKALPKSDPQIVRVSMRRDEMSSNATPTPAMGREMAIQHVPNAGTKT